MIEPTSNPNAGVSALNGAVKGERGKGATGGLFAKLMAAFQSQLKQSDAVQGDTVQKVGQQGLKTERSQHAVKTPFVAATVKDGTSSGVTALQSDAVESGLKAGQSDRLTDAPSDDLKGAVVAGLGKFHGNISTKLTSDSSKQPTGRAAISSPSVGLPQKSGEQAEESLAASTNKNGKSKGKNQPLNGVNMTADDSTFSPASETLKAAPVAGLGKGVYRSTTLFSQPYSQAAVQDELASHLKNKADAGSPKSANRTPLEATAHKLFHGDGAAALEDTGRDQPLAAGRRSAAHVSEAMRHHQTTDELRAGPDSSLNPALPGKARVVPGSQPLQIQSLQASGAEKMGAEKMAAQPGGFGAGTSQQEMGSGSQQSEALLADPARGDLKATRSADFAAYINHKSSSQVYKPAEAMLEIARSAKEGGMKLELQLEPAHLGKVQVTLQSDASKQLQVHFTVDQSLSRQIIEQHLPQLRSALAEQGIDMGQFSMNMNSNGGSGASGDGSSEAHPFGQFAAHGLDADGQQQSTTRLGINRADSGHLSILA